MIQLNLTRREIHVLAMALTEHINKIEGQGYPHNGRDELIGERKTLRDTLLELVK